MDNYNISLDYNENKFDDQKTWDLICSGDTVGVFQLESNTGKKYAKLVAPRNIDQLSQLVAVIRPGVLQARMDDGRSLIDHYIDRKHGKEMVDYIHPDLKPILQNTYGILVFQESAIKIGQDIGGMNLSDSDTYIRYAIGKKKTSLIDKGRSIFIDGAVAKGMERHIAEQIFSWIEAGQRYSFNACVDPNTTVQTQNGIKTLEDINIGDYVLCPNLSTGIDEMIEVVNKYDNGMQDLYEIELEDGKKIKCTLTHKFLCEDMKIRPLQEILDNDHQIICEQ